MLQVKVGAIDMYGYNGRDNHPKKEDEGLIGEVVGYETFVMGGDDGEDDSEEPYEERVYRVQFEDGRIVELIEHEIASIEIVRGK